MDRILVIKLGALGDMVQAVPAFQAIRAHHPNAQLTLLTKPPYDKFAEIFNIFDDIWMDQRVSPLKISTYFPLLHRLIKGRFDRIYDLQMVDRTNTYFNLIKPFWKGEWVGSASRCHFPFPESNRCLIQSRKRHSLLLSQVGISDLPPYDISSFSEKHLPANLTKPYVLLIPGASTSLEGQKIWPIENYAKVAETLVEEGVLPVIIGGPENDNTIIAQVSPLILDLTGKTTFQTLITIGANAAFAIGNDTGPLHVASASGAPTITLFSGLHDPEIVGPRGPKPTYLMHKPLSDLPVERVIEAAKKYISEMGLREVS